MRKIIRDLLSKSQLADGMFRRFIWSRFYFPEVELKTIQSLQNGAFDVALDVGGALGSYAWVLGRKAQTVYCFEPGKTHYSFMRKSAILSNVEVVEAAVGDSPGEAELFTPGDDTNARHSATLSRDNPVSVERGTKTRIVPVVTLDQFALQNIAAQRSIDLIKIDVEGFENAVLKGAFDIIQSHFPVIIVEIEIRHNPDYGNAFQLLGDMDYETFAFVNGRYRPVGVTDVPALQSEEALAYRLGDDYSSDQNKYINNFVFQHRNSRVKVIKL